MGRVNNTIDKFGRRQGVAEKLIRGPPGIGFKFATDRQYDLENKVLHFVIEQTHSIRRQIMEFINKELMTLILATKKILTSQDDQLERRINRMESLLKKKNLDLDPTFLLKNK